jgi:predicted MFS family arabinose efflux permease
MDGSRAGTSDASIVPAVTPYYRYGLFVLFLMCTVNYVDRQVVTILAEPIKQDLGLTDTQVGVLTGLVFGLVYCGLGIPVSRLADRGRRVPILSIALAFWSLCTMLCGRAGGYGGLLAARLGVGAGEAGFIPTALALATDFAPRERRASAIAFFTTGTQIGSLLGLAFGGVLASAYGWRSAFMLVGVPGLLLALVSWLTMREKPYQSALPEASTNHHAPLRAVLSRLATKRSFWLVSLGAAVKAFIGFGQAPFIAAFFLRAHTAEITHLGQQFGLRPIGVVGVGLGAVAGICGAVSNWLGGVIGDRLSARDSRALVTIPTFSALLAVPFNCAALFAPTVRGALLLLAPAYLAAGLWYGPGLACIQGVVPAQMRATASAIAVFIINIIGMGLGAVAVGALSDFFQHRLGLDDADGVRWALAVSSTAGLLAAALFWAARPRVRDELES